MVLGASGLILVAVRIFCGLGIIIHNFLPKEILVVLSFAFARWRYHSMRRFELFRGLLLLITVA